MQENDRYNILTTKLPETVQVSGVEVPINTDFRIGIRFDDLMHSEKSDEEKIFGLLLLYYPDLPQDLDGAVMAAVRFFAAWRDIPEHDDGAGIRASEKKEICSFSQDAPYIYAAFRQQYGINLQTISSGELHWWEFLALFEALDENTLIRRIMYYRNVPLSDFKGKERKRIQELKRIYRLKNDAPMDAKTALAKRNADMKAYVMKRLETVNAHR